MPLTYEASSRNGPFRQGELLGDIWEHRPDIPPIDIPEGTNIAYRSIHHSKVMVMNPACDIEWDYRARFQGDEAQQTLTPGEIEKPGVLISHVLLCDVYDIGGIQTIVPPGRDIWKRVEQNQDERYHHLVVAEIGVSTAITLPDLYLDFKKVFGIPTEQLYEGLRAAAITRIAVMPPIYLHDLMHRFYGFLSRIALPD